MRLGLFAAAAGLLFCTLSARANDITYSIAVTGGFPAGPATGTITGSGTTVSAYDFTAGDQLLHSFTFDSTVAGDSVELFDTHTQTAATGGAEIFEMIFDDGSNDTAAIYYTGDLTAGPTPVSYGTTVYKNGSATGQHDYGFILSEPSSGSLDNITLTPETTTPEPSSIVLLGTGLLGIAGMVRKRLA